jgi:hypothetical protein
VGGGGVASGIGSAGGGQAGARRCTGSAAGRGCGRGGSRTEGSGAVRCRTQLNAIEGLRAGPADGGRAPPWSAPPAQQGPCYANLIAFLDLPSVTSISQMGLTNLKSMKMVGTLPRLAPLCAVPSWPTPLRASYQPRGWLTTLGPHGFVAFVLLLSGSLQTRPHEGGHPACGTRSRPDQSAGSQVD